MNLSFSDACACVDRLSERVTAASRFASPLQGVQALNEELDKFGLTLVTLGTAIQPHLSDDGLFQRLMLVDQELRGGGDLLAKKFQRLYNQLAQQMDDADWFTFMNHGYVPSPQRAVALSKNDERWRYQVYLYYHLMDVAGDVRSSRPNEKDVLEVGSGRGGGLAALKRRFNCRRAVGLDVSEKQIAFCRRIHTDVGLEFYEGSALALPFPDRSFDFVVNVESSHCYPGFQQFLSETRRVLKRGGLFLFADVRPSGISSQLMDLALRRSGMNVLAVEDITDSVARACAADRKRFPEVLPATQEQLEWLLSLTQHKEQEYSSKASTYVVYIMESCAN